MVGGEARWGRGGGRNNWILIDECSCSCATDQHHLYSDLTEKDTRWQATNSSRSNSIGDKIELGYLKRYFTFTLRGDVVISE